MKDSVLFSKAIQFYRLEFNWEVFYRRHFNRKRRFTSAKMEKRRRSGLKLIISWLETNKNLTSLLTANNSSIKGYTAVPLARFDPHRNSEFDRAQEYT